MNTFNLRDTAHTLMQTHGMSSPTVAAERADERFANIDVGGYAYWKHVETFIRGVLKQNA
jgi:hypothetical protein